LLTRIETFAYACVANRSSLNKKCSKALPAVRGIAGWTFCRNDSLIFVDLAGRQVLALREVCAITLDQRADDAGNFVINIKPGRDVWRK